MGRIPATDKTRVATMVGWLRAQRGDPYAAALGLIETDMRGEWVTDRDARQHAVEVLAALDLVLAERQAAQDEAMAELRRWMGT